MVLQCSSQQPGDADRERDEGESLPPFFLPGAEFTKETAMSMKINA